MVNRIFRSGICAALALVVANFIPLQAIATAGSAGFLLLFFFVNVASVRLAGDTGARAWISGLAAFSSAGALAALCWNVAENPATRSHLYVVVGMIVASVLIECLYRGSTGRKISLKRRKVP